MNKKIIMSVLVGAAAIVVGNIAYAEYLKRSAA